MRIHAYVLAADPAFIEASVLSYYDIVDRIVVSYDKEFLGWSGKPIEVEQCLRRLSRIDAEGKLVLSPGSYRSKRTNEDLLALDTAQRQAALNEASEGADWVLQIDTDEVVPDARRLRQSLTEAEADGRQAVYFPQLWLLARTEHRYLARCSRWGRLVAAYPGPVAVRAGTTLTLCRQTDVTGYRVDIGALNTDPWTSRDVVVDAQISPAAAIHHFAWVRTDEEMAAKERTSGHSRESFWPSMLAFRERAVAAPLITLATNPLRSREQRFRAIRLPSTMEALMRLAGPDGEEA